jgi:predicted RNase H-like HicB family nuclease
MLNSPERCYRFDIALIPEAEGDWSAVVLNLPGTGSCGATEDEAMENAKEAIQASMEEYFDSGAVIPWKEVTSADIPVGAVRKAVSLAF